MTPDEYEFSQVLEQVLEVVRMAHLRQVAERNPSVIKHLKNQLNRLQAEKHAG